MKTLVIHVVDRSTDFLKPIYEGKGFTVMRNPKSPHEVNQAIADHDRVIMLGHGLPGGLFGAGGYAISDMSVPWLMDKPNIYVWCNANRFVEHHGLSGFYSGMFISEVGEAHYCGVTTTWEKIQASNDKFAEIVGRHVNESPEDLCRAVHAEYVEEDADGQFSPDSVIDYNCIQMKYQ